MKNGRAFLIIAIVAQILFWGISIYGWIFVQGGMPVPYLPLLGNVSGMNTLIPLTGLLIISFIFFMLAVACNDKK